MTWDVTSWFKEQCERKAPNVIRRLNAGYIKDYSSNQYDGVGLGNPLFVAGTLCPHAMRFDGVDDYFAIMEMFYDSSSLDHGLTVEARIKVSSEDIESAVASADNLVIASFDRSEYWRLGVGSQVDSAHKPSFSLRLPAGNEDLSGGSDVVDDQLHLLTVRYDPSTNGGQVKFFLDGASDFVVDSLGTVWGSGARRYGLVGKGSEASVFNGSGNDNECPFHLEELRIWHVPRTDAEISSASGVTSLDVSSGLQLHWLADRLGDLSERVIRWPTIRRHWSDLRPQSISVELANDDGALDVFFNRPQAGITTFALQIGFTDGSSEELITPFAGRLNSVEHEDGRLRLTVDDKVAALSDLGVGDTDNPVTYTDSSLPSDIAWNLLTEHGGFSDVESTSNPDINYASFADWAAIFSGDSVQINGYFDGQKVTEAMRKLARYTQSAIYMEGGRMQFHRFSAINTETVNLGPDEVVDTRIRVDMLELVTKQTVLGGYDVDSESWEITASDISSEESISYGLREQTEKDENLWYVDSVSCLNLAQRFTTVGGNPYEQLEVTSILKPLPYQVGETVNFVDPQLEVSKGYRIMGMELNFEEATTKLTINASQTETPFMLDFSELDGDDKLL